MSVVILWYIKPKIKHLNNNKYIQVDIKVLNKAYKKTQVVNNFVYSQLILAFKATLHLPNVLLKR